MPCTSDLLHALMTMLHSVIFFKPSPLLSPSAHSLHRVSASADKQHTVNINRRTTLSRPLSVTDLTSQPSHGSPLRVAYQGLPGAYSEAAACRAYPNCEAVPCEQFEAAFQAVELLAVDRAVLPIENSLGGSIHRNYDLLTRHKLHIVGEVQLSVHHYLLGLPWTEKEKSQRVLTHPQFIAALRLRAARPITSANLAEMYGFEILEDNSQDDKDNITRFLMLAREPVVPHMDRPYKTSIVFTLGGGPGVLFKVLRIFALREINLTKIESRPLQKGPLHTMDDSNKMSAKHFSYLFFLDFEASMAEQRAKNALHHLQEFTTFLRVLGSYPMDATSGRSFQTF